MESSSIIATYKGLTFRVYVDGAGLDIEATDEESLKDIAKTFDGVAHELFRKVFDYGYAGRLAEALLNSGATLKSKVGA